MTACIPSCSGEWIIEESGPKTPEWNMEADRLRLEALTEDARPFFRFYEWSAPSVTYGYFVDPLEFFDPEGVAKHDLLLARRPTGGGIIFHGYDLAFSLIVPSSHPFYSLNSLESYACINQLILSALDSRVELGQQEATRGGFCMTKPTKYDLMREGKKVGGAAQRKTKKGLLHQGSLCLSLPIKGWLKEVLKNGEALFTEMEQTSFPLGLSEKEKIKERIIQRLQRGQSPR